MVNEFSSQQNDSRLTKGTHVVAYCRDSGAENRDGTLKQQEQAIQEYCHQHGLILERVYTDEVSGSSNQENRPGLIAMLTDLTQRFPPKPNLRKLNLQKEEHAFGVVVWKSDRLSRDRQELTQIKVDLRLRDIKFVELASAGH